MTSPRLAVVNSFAVFIVAAFPIVLKAASPSAPDRSAWTFSTSLAVRESYDNNVYMQDITARAHHGSAVTTLLPAGSITWKPSRKFTLGASYSPEASFYDRASSENNITHKIAATLAGQYREMKWDLGNTLTIVDGESSSPTFTGQGGSVILGGVPLLERRDQRMLRQNFKAQIPLGTWFVRPIASTYIHDFRTAQRTTAGYQNYIDRNEYAGGLDAGKKLSPALTLFAGFRYGTQDQAASPVSPFQYDNQFRRLLAGAEAAPLPWLKLSLLAGSDRRSFASSVPPTLDRGLTRFFLDATATATAGKSDSGTFSAKRFALPGYGGGSFLEITALDLSWKHTFNSAFSATLTGRAHHWDFARPVLRNEWWHGAGVTVAAKISARVSFVAAIARDAVRSKIANTPGREATRTLCSLFGSYSF
jgi:hypothetical protein